MKLFGVYREWRNRRRALSLLGQWLNPAPPSREGLLRDAQKDLLSLRKGEQTAHWVEKHIKAIERAIEAGWSYDEVGTTHNEVMSFRRGESQKIWCRKKLKDFQQNPEKDWIVLNILGVTREVGFPLEEIGMNRKEVASIIRETDRRTCTRLLNDIRAFARGEKQFVNVHEEGSKGRISSVE